MMLSHLGYAGEEARIEEAVALAIRERKCTRDVGGELGTRAAADFVLSEIQRAS